uniref:Uncharacterized protein n=1 Tax=Rhizophora mucronata TaxID=61149 RepID=A0A2P2PU49_RHIMU
MIRFHFSLRRFFSLFLFLGI